MKQKHLLGTLLLSSLATAATFGQQPYGGSWHPDFVKNWSPENDPDAKFNRSTVKLQPRIDANDVKANQYQFADAQIGACLTMNPSCSMTPAQGADNFIGYNPTYWQYMDIVVWWGGSSGEGIIVPPSAPFTDVCHMNGVKVLGNVFFPPTAFGGKSEWVRQMLTVENGVYPYAEKMYEIAKYYGFDGWFLNEETYASQTSEWEAWIKYFYQCAEADGDTNMEIQWYDANVGASGVTSLLKINERVSFMANYGSCNYISSNKSTLENAGITGQRFYKQLYSGIEKAQGGITGNASEFQKAFPSSGHASSMQIFNPEEHVWKQVVKDLLDTENNNGEQAYTAMKKVFSNEARLWTNASNNPADVSDRNNTYTWPGLANAILERSVIQNKPFVTSFSAGLGKHRFVNGEKRGTQDWYHRGMQSIMPTWRWWVETSSSDKLTFDLNWDDAYNFGTSVVVSGNMTANADHLVRLYKTKLSVDSGDKFQLVYKSSNAGNIELKLGIKENGNEFQTIQLGETTTNNGWTVASADLSALAGKTISIIALNLKTPSTVSNYKLTLGQLSIMPASYSASAKVSNMQVQRELQEERSDIRLIWDAPASEEVDHYDVYLERNGGRQLVGQTRDEGFYIPYFVRADGEHSLNVGVVAVTKDMKEGEEVRLKLDYPAMGKSEVSITAVPTLAKVGEEITLTATANKKPKTYEWVLPSAGEIISQNGNTAKVKFNKEGLYSITVKVTNEAGETVETLNNLIEISNAGDLTNVALNKKIHSVSGNMNGEGPDHLLDGRITGLGVHDKWCTGGAKEHWVIIDLEQPYQLYKFRSVDANVNEAGQPNLNCYKILLSNDLENWNEVVNATGRSAEDYHTDWIKPTVARYIKFVPYDTDAPITIRIWEFEAYGRESSMTLGSIDDQSMSINSTLEVKGSFNLGGMSKEDNFAITATTDNADVAEASAVTIDEEAGEFSFTITSKASTEKTGVRVSLVNGEFEKSVNFTLNITDPSLQNLVLNLLPAYTPDNAAGYEPTNAGELKNVTDGDYNTTFAPNYGDDAIEARFVFTFDKLKSISRFVMNFANEYTAETTYPTNVKLEASEDGEQFEEVYTFTQPASETEKQAEIAYNLPARKNALSIAVTVGLDGFYSTIIKELEVYGTDGSGIESAEENAAFVSPNPVNRGEALTVAQAGATSIELCSLDGKIVKRVAADAVVTSVDTSDLSSGIYLLLVKSEEGVHTVKVTIK